jgi:hypothetical protein
MRFCKSATKPPVMEASTPLEKRVQSAMQVIDQHPYGLLGFMMAEEEARQAGSLDSFYQLLDEYPAESNLPSLDEGGCTARPFIESGRRMITFDPATPEEKKLNPVFSAVYPGGIVYGSRNKLIAGDYQKLAILRWNLVLDIHVGTPRDLSKIIQLDVATIRQRRGSSFQVNAQGDIVILGA